MLLGSETLAGEAIQDPLRRLENDDLTTAKAATREYDIVEEYLERIVGDIQLQKPLSIVVDCGNGVAGAFARCCIAASTAGCELFCDVDGTFPNHHPDPSQPKTCRT